MEIQNKPHTSRMNMFASFIVALALVFSVALLLTTKNFGPMFKFETTGFLWFIFVLLFISIWFLLSKIFQQNETEMGIFEVLSYFLAMVFLLILTSGILASSPAVRDILMF